MKWGYIITIKQIKKLHYLQNLIFKKNRPKYYNGKKLPVLFVRATLLVFDRGIIAGNFQLNKIKDEKHTTARALQQQYFILLNQLFSSTPHTRIACFLHAMQHV